MTTRPETCSIYLRISEDDTGDRDAVTRHGADCRALAARLGLSVGSVYEDNDTSATRPGVRRAAFERMLIELPPGSVILTWHPDRLIRKMSDLERLIARELVVHSVHAGAVDLSTPTGRAVARTVTAWSQHEGEHRAARQRSALDQARARGEWSGGRRCLGYTVGMLDFFEPEAQAVRDGYRWLLEGHGPAEIARRWNAAGLRTTQTGVEWKSSWVAPVLSNPTYAGLRTHHGAIVGDAAWPALIERGTWEAAQVVLAAPERRQNKSPKGSSLLAGIACCGFCGAVLHAGGNTVRGGLYVCSTQRHLSVRRPDVDEYVLGFVAEMLAVGDAFEGHTLEVEELDGTVTRWAPKPPQPATADPALIRELTLLEQQLDALADDLGLDLRVLARRTTAINARIEALRVLLQDCVSVAPEPQLSLEDLLPLGEFETYVDAFEAADVAARRGVIRRLITVTVLPPGRGSRAFRPETVVIEPAVE